MLVTQFGGTIAQVSLRSAVTKFLGIGKVIKKWKRELNFFF